MTLLEAVAWTAETIAAWRDAKFNDQPVMRKMKLVEQPRAEIAKSVSDTIDGIFAAIPSRERKIVDGGIRTVIGEGKREDCDNASQQAYSLLQTDAGRAAFEQTARSYVLQKASPNAHHYKYWIAAFENAKQISQEWQPLYLSASIHYGFGPQTPDNNAIVRAKQVMTGTG